ncbi:nucleoside-diphosphate sugar epimerase [Paenibacillus crassostreae]|uniref:Nucleoside-diphosphate sugar epimerase n=1 Tax=Paenibacillus crassostreae TaxID=1763538 RepID=A0A167GGH0_9BACL|nr:nucleoside-diphosphate sugar epimerase [Paenibacillus crassostreae]AOZ91966.1 nucleoside-diphosphate sugar epimerase [Paenibacillus crassostreae]OAB77550.1 nucleoside-diphosphate sugar epimerase [Paenibacillus crassostreae]
MQSKIDGMIHHMSNSQQQMARVLDAERQMAAHMAQIIHNLPDSKVEFEGITTIINHTREVNKSIISYLFGLADLEESLATNLNYVIKELGNQESHEEE